MGKFDGVLLASDFDNTLLNTETARRTGAEVPEVSRRNREALEYFMAGGGRFAIATGRALAAFIKFADQVPMNAPGIVCNGAALYDFQKGEYLETILLDESTRRRGQETLDRFPTLAVEAYHIDNVIHAVRPNLYTRQHEHVTHVSVVEKPSLLDVPLPLGKIMFEEDHAVLEEVKAFLQSQPGAGEYEFFVADLPQLERNEAMPEAEKLVRISRQFGVSTDYLLLEELEEPETASTTAPAAGLWVRVKQWYRNRGYLLAWVLAAWVSGTWLTWLFLRPIHTSRRRTSRILPG